MRWFTDSSGVSFGYDGKLHFQSVAPEESSKCPQSSEVDYSMIGCYVLSGSRGPLHVVWSDGKKQHSKTICRVMGRFAVLDEQKDVKKAICGPVCLMPDKMAILCKHIGHQVVYVCPLVRGLAALGAMIAAFPEIKSVTPAWPNTDTLDLPCKEFDKELDGDGYGRMADLLSKGMSVLNQMVKTPAYTAFYDRVLSMESHDNPVYLVRRVDASRIFATEPTSVREYAASMVPVEMVNTNEFRDMTGCTDDKVSVMVSSGYNQGMADFMRFFKVLSGRCWVRSYEPSCFKFKGNIPTFRHHGGYNVSGELYREICNA